MDRIEIHDPGNEIDIQDLYAFLSVDEEGRQGICGTSLGSLGMTPLVTGKASLVQAMQDIARQISRETGKRVHLYRFRRDANPIWRTAE